MAKVSIIIPSRNEKFLVRTIDECFAKATGEIEVIACIDEQLPNPMPMERHNLALIYQTRPRGLRAGDNACAGLATGKYLLKLDAHVALSEGFDEILQKDYDDDWVVIMRRYSLDPDTWQKTEKGPVDYHYLDCPWTNPEFFQMHGVIWPELRSDPKHANLMIDETPSFQGSQWFMSRRHWDWLGGLSEVGYGTFAQEPQEIGMKTWLGGGKVMVNKNCWYAHLHKGQRFGRMYNMSQREVHRGHMYSAHYWTTDQWKDRIYDFGWFIDHFWPMKAWPANWRDYYEGRLHYEGIQ